MIDIFTGIIKMIGGLGGELIEDKDKKTEFAFKMAALAEKRMEVLMNQKTYPWVDGLVKLAYASEQIVKGLFRPVASSLMLAVAVYFEINDIKVSGTVETILYGALPAWGVSRHMDKNKS